MHRIIQSSQNPRIKAAMKLRQRRGRRQQQRLIVDGVREVGRALKAGVLPIEVFVTQSMATQVPAEGPARQISDLMSNHGLEPTVVADAVLDKLAYGQRGADVVLVGSQPRHNLAQLDLPEESVLCVLESIEKPGNLGAILRTAEATGVNAVIVVGQGTELYNPNVIRASLGTVFLVPVVACSATELLNWLRRRGTRLMAARVDGTIGYSSANWTGDVAMILGSESDGLSDTWMAPDITPIVLPMMGQVDSLNVAATAAVLCYEALRQRQLD